MIWFLEDYRDDVVLVVRVQHFELPDLTDLRHRSGHCDSNHDAKLEPALAAAAPRLLDHSSCSCPSRARLGHC